MPGEPGGDTWPGETAKLGGGSTWITGSYDPESNTVFWGIGNPGPFNAAVRKGDNLYTNSVLAVQDIEGAVAVGIHDDLEAIAKRLDPSTARGAGRIGTHAAISPIQPRRPFESGHYYLARRRATSRLREA
jgi:hypothetical protein